LPPSDETQSPLNDSSGLFLEWRAGLRQEFMPKIRKIPKKSFGSKGNRKRADWDAEIGPVPSAPEQPSKSRNETIEIDKWLKLVESYWEKGTRRKA